MGWGVIFCLENFQIAKFSQPAKILKSHCSSPLPFHLPSAANPSFPAPTINFPFFLNQPFNRHLRPLIGKKIFICPPSLYKALFFLSFSFHIPLPFSEASLPPSFFSFSCSRMVKTYEGRAFRPQVRRSSPPPTGCSSPAAPAAAASPTAAPTATAPPTTTHAAAQGSAALGSSASTLAPRRYHTRVGPTPPSPPHPSPSQRASPSKWAHTSGPRESYSYRPQEPQSPPHQGLIGAPTLDLSPASIIWRPLFHCNPIPRNVDCSERDLHDEVYYDLSSFSVDPELRDSMILVQRYSLEPFMTPRRFFYPRVVIEFYHTMTSKRKSNPTTLHFSIDGRPAILSASDIAATFNLPVVLANSASYRQWPHPLPREMVRLIFGDTIIGSVLFRRQLSSRMLLIDHILRSNLSPLQHTT